MSELLQMQAPKGVPRSSVFETVTDPLLPPSRVEDMLAHFPDQIYDKRPQSHLSLLLRVLLGSSGTGQLRKRYTYAHLSQFLSTIRYNDLDQFFSGVFGIKRFIRERLDIDAYNDAATDAEWEAINAADASYRSRIEAFTAALSMAGTPSGLVTAANAVLGTECRLYEGYEFLDMGSDLPFDTRLPAGGRNEFVIRPLREITPEEHLHLVRVLDRIKPSDALMTIDTSFAHSFSPVPITSASASSTYWHIQRRVLVSPETSDSYVRYAGDGVPVEQPRLAGSQYQGEEWNYNTEVLGVTSYVENPDGAVVQNINFDRHVDRYGNSNDYRPGLGLLDPQRANYSRQTRDGVLNAPLATRGAR